LGEKVERIGGALGFIAGGGLLIIPALVMVLFALSAALIAGGWSPSISYMTAAILAFVIAGVLLAIGISRLNARNLTPRETIRQLEKDKDVVKGMVQ
jgi:membrane protein implicated in regulation of membrane protease activity